MIENAIVKHIFNSFGVPQPTGTFSILSPSYILKKELSIELEDGEVVQKKVWGVEGKVSGSTIKILVADTTIDTEQEEYILVLQLDDLSVYVLKFENYTDGINRAFVAHTDTWAQLSTLLLAKLFAGVEQLNELFVGYQPITNYHELYKQLIGFLNYEEAIQNNKQA